MERKCKQCETNIDNKNMNTIYCSDKCRVKWNYYNKDTRDKKLSKSREKTLLKWKEKENIKINNIKNLQKIIENN